MMRRILAVVISGCFALAGGGVGVAGLSYGTHSPRLLAAGAIAAVVGTLLGGVLLDRAIDRAADLKSASGSARARRVA
jgi:hypothetical protein